jgi:hypothetical protein
MNGRIYSIVTNGNDVMVGGTFTQIRASSSSSPLIAQPYLFKFNVQTGQIDNSFRPVLNGDVEGIRYSQDGQSVFVGGAFTLVNGVSRQRMVKLNATTGAIDSTFVAQTSGRVKDLDVANGNIVIGGEFRFVNGVLRERLAMLDPSTGAALASFNLPVTGSRDAFAPYVQELETSDDGRWLVVGGNFVSIGGQSRHQVAVVDLAGAAAQVADWQTDGYVRDCASVYDDTWIRGIDISPDNTWFTIGTTGAFLGNQVLCDTATRWELPPTQSGVALEPTWVAHTGGDTHWAMHITNEAIFAGGHQRWENNANPSPGGDNDGPGAVSRPGIAALDPLTGVPLSWNPTRDRGRGVEAFASTPHHLFVGSDTTLFNGQVRQRLAVLPTAGGFENPSPDTIDVPVELRYAVDDKLFATTFDGVDFTPPTQVGGTGIDDVNWNEVRDGFAQRGQFTYYGPDNAFFRRPISGGTFGAPTNLSTSVGYVDLDRDLTPYDQPYGMAETVSAAYHQGRIYYIKSNDSRLFWRWYSIQSGIAGSQEYLASGVNFSTATALDVVGGWLLISQNDGTLQRAKLSPNGGVDLTTLTLVDNGTSGVDWAAVDVMFSTQVGGVGTPFPDPTPVECDDPSLPWKATYHANKTLTAPTNVRCEAQINNRWGNGSPAGTLVGPDNFSVRWERQLEVNDGQKLRFTAGSDDGIRVYLDGVLIINDWVDRGYTERVVETGALAGGEHDIVVEYYENGGGADAVLRVEPFGEVLCNDPAFPWSTSYYDNTSLSGTPVLQRCEAVVDADFGLGAPSGTGLGNDNYSIRYARQYDLAQDRALRITGGSDDGIRIAVDGTLVLNDWFARAYSQRTVETSILPAGPHEIVVSFYEAGGDARVYAAIEEIVPPDITAPDTTITSPAAAQVVNSVPQQITGTATDNVGVASVQVAVQNTVSGEWLQADGATFAPSLATLDAVVSTPGATSTNWSLSISAPTGSYSVTATATDTSTNQDATSATRSFSVDTTPPDTVAPDGLAGTPTKNQVVTTATPTFTGTATDDRGVTRVTLSIRNVSTLQYLRPDGGWQAGFTQIESLLAAPGATSTGWSLVAPGSLPNGSYRYEVRAFDAANNLDPTRPSVVFSVAS